MTMPDERARSLRWMAEFLMDLTRRTEVPAEIRQRAARILEHFPLEWEIDDAAEAIIDHCPIGGPWMERDKHWLRTPTPHLMIDARRNIHPPNVPPVWIKGIGPKFAVDQFGGLYDWHFLGTECPRIAAEMANRNTA